jgi:hypothetical protein
MFIIPFIIIIGGILVLFIHITRLASNEIFSPSNKIYREVGRAKDLSTPRFKIQLVRKTSTYEVQLIHIELRNCTALLQE